MTTIENVPQRNSTQRSNSKRIRQPSVAILNLSTETNCPSSALTETELLAKPNCLLRRDFNCKDRSSQRTTLRIHRFCNLKKRQYIYCTTFVISLFIYQARTRFLCSRNGNGASSGYSCSGGGGGASAVWARNTGDGHPEPVKQCTHVKTLLGKLESNNTQSRY